MKDINKKDRCGRIKWFLIGSALTVTGFIVIPPLIQKYGSKAYNKSLNTDAIDFDEMGPKIVPFEEKAKEEE